MKLIEIFERQREYDIYCLKGYQKTRISKLLLLVWAHISALLGVKILNLNA
jgi:hypothetical protein